jgi:hypothetical protein
MRTLWSLGRLRNVYWIRGAAVWVGVRLMAGWVQIGNPGVLQELWFLGVVGAAVYWDARRRSEDIMLANLGVPGWAIAVTGAAGALPLELFVP